MFRIFISFILVSFLFLGLIGAARVMFKSSEKDDIKVAAKFSEKKDLRLSIKEIESLTASGNYHFTSVNLLN